MIVVRTAQPATTGKQVSTPTTTCDKHRLVLQINSSLIICHHHRYGGTRTLFAHRWTNRQAAPVLSR